MCEYVHSKMDYFFFELLAICIRSSADGKQKSFEFLKAFLSLNTQTGVDVDEAEGRRVGDEDAKRCAGCIKAGEKEENSLQNILSWDPVSPELKKVHSGFPALQSLAWSRLHFWPIYS